MKLGRLGFTGIDINSRSSSLGIYRPETNVNIQSYNGELDNYTYSGKFLDLTSQIGGFEHITSMVMKPDGSKLYLLKNGTSFDSIGGLSQGTKTIYQIDLAEPCDISTGTYNNKFLNLPVSNFFASTTNRNPQVMGMVFHPDGSKFYILTRKYTNNSSSIYSERKVFQYSTSISENAWDISTYTYDNVFLDMGTSGEIDGKPSASTNYLLSADTDLYFSSDGLAMFIIFDARYPNSTETIPTDNNSIDSIQKWSMNSEWDVENAYLPNYFYTLPRSVNNGMAFKDDLSRYYVVGNGTLVYQNTLTTSGTFADGVVSGSEQSFNLSNYHSGNNIQSVIFKSNGLSYYFCGENGYIVQIDTNSAWNINQSVNLIPSLSLSSATTTPINFKFNNNGFKLYILCSNPSEIEEFSLSIAYDISSATRTGSVLSLASNYYNSFHFNSNGSRLYLVTSETQSTIIQYNLSLNYDLSTATIMPFGISNPPWTDPGSSGSQISEVRDMYFRSDGYKLYLLTSGSFNSTRYSVYQIDLTTPWVISSGTYTSGNKVSVRDTSAAGGSNPVFNTDSSQYRGKRGLSFSPDGSILYMLESNAYSIGTEFRKQLFQYSLSPAWQVNSATLTGISTNPIDGWSRNNTLIWSPFGLAFSSDGEYMYTTFFVNAATSYGTEGGTWSIFTLKLNSGGTRWNVDSYVYDSQRSLFTSSSPVSGYRGFKFKTDGSVVYFLGISGSTATLVAHLLTTNWNPGFSTATHTSPSLIGISEIDDFYFKDDGTVVYFVSENSRIISCELRTAWDIRTLKTYSLKTLTTCVDLFINSDDSYMFTGETNNNVYRYAPRSGTTSPYDIHDYQISGISTNAHGSNTSSTVLTGLYFKSDGYKMYSLLESSSYVREWDLSENWNLGTRSSNSIVKISPTLNISRRISNSSSSYLGMSLVNDGSKIITIDPNNDTIKSHNLNTNWDVTFLPLFNNLLDIYSSTTSTIYDLFFDSTQQNLYFVDNYQIFNFRLSFGGTAGRIKDYLYVNKISVTSWNIPSTATIKSIFFKPDGSRIYLTLYDTGSSLLNDEIFELFQIDLNTNWNLNSANLSSIKKINPASSSLFASAADPNYLLFNSNGSKIYLGISNSSVYEFELQTPWDIGGEISGTSTYTTLRQDSKQVIIENRPNSLLINSDNNKLYFTGISSAATLYKRNIPFYSSTKSIDSFENGKSLYIGYYSGVLGGTAPVNTAKICGFSIGKEDGFDTFRVVASDNKIYQFEVIKS